MLQVQELIFDRKKFNVQKAARWAQQNNFKFDGAIGDDLTIRIPQKEADDTSARQINLVDGVKALVAKADRTITKSQPGGSEVHVPTAGYEKKKKIGKEGDGMMEQNLVRGMDYEMETYAYDADTAIEVAAQNLALDPGFYDDEDAKGLRLDLGCGINRQPGFIGLDLYPHDNGTLIHDLTLGIPFPDGSCECVRLVNMISDFQGDVGDLLMEIHRVLMPGGTFVYCGEHDLGEYPDDMLLISREDKLVKKSLAYKMQMLKIDAATANDSEPASLNERDRLAYESRGEYTMGSPENDMIEKGGPGSGPHGGKGKGKKKPTDNSGGGGKDDHGHGAGGGHSGGSGFDIYGAAADTAEKSAYAKIAKADGEKKIIYCVVLTPNEVDAQDEWMSPEDIERTAHLYLQKSRVVGKNHQALVKAVPVESYISPTDWKCTGPDGDEQLVKKGAWVIAIKILDDAEWNKVLDGEYTGVSIGGFGLRV